MGFFERSEKTDDRIETRTIAQVGHENHMSGEHYRSGLRFTDDPETLHTVKHLDLGLQSRLEVRMLERGDSCEVVSKSDGKDHWTICNIRTLALRKD